MGFEELKKYIFLVRGTNNVVWLLPPTFLFNANKWIKHNSHLKCGLKCAKYKRGIGYTRSTPMNNASALIEGNGVCRASQPCSSLDWTNSISHGSPKTLISTLEFSLLLLAGWKYCFDWCPGSVVQLCSSVCSWHIGHNWNWTDPF